MTWHKSHKCKLPELDGTEKLGDYWTCDECGDMWAISKDGKFVFVPPFLHWLQRSVVAQLPNAKKDGKQ